MSDSPDSVFAIPSPSLSLSGCDLKNSKRPVSCSTNIDKVTKLKFIVAIFSLCAYSFTAGLCFHYVISTVSIVIFVVSAIIVLISVVYLASSIVSSLNGKQKIDFSEKESAQPAQRQEYTALRQSTQGLEYNATPSPSPPPPPLPPLPLS
ncbi:hypothetical protein [Wolbachia endosymbiont (group E) of Neria commutata]|uniref:hypothetical protein n=1 Tax=Wolbachia endosymbiont (group E) of Neria commutata TaxID=3066149 RepID=UPI0031329D6C